MKIVLPILLHFLLLGSFVINGVATINFCNPPNVMIRYAWATLLQCKLMLKNVPEGRIKGL
jgi:hypothetical protein